MKRLMYLAPVAATVVMLMVSDAGAVTGSLYSKKGLPGGSLIADHTARSVGDIVTIIVEEESSASQDVNTTTSKTSGTEAAIETLFFPKTSFFKDNKEDPTFKWDSTSDFSGKGSTDSKGSLETKLTARVIDVFPNGNLLIEGSRTIQIDESNIKMILTGVIRPADIANDNTISSSSIADAKIEYVQEGFGNVNKFGVVTKFWNWLNIF